MAGKVTKSVAERFWSKVERTGPGECWIWTGARDSYGYGYLWVGDRLRKASHVALYLATGEWPTDKVLHTCDNPPCVNDAHLFEGSQLDNIRDAVAKGRHGSPPRKLSIQKAHEIRARHVRNCRTNGVRALGRDYGVSRATIYRILTGRV